MKKRILTIYLVMLHALVGVILLKSDFVPRVREKLGLESTDELSPHFHRMLAYHNRSVDIVPPGSILFIGDSMTQGLCVTAVAPNSVNYGIGSDTSVGVLERLDDYEHAIANAASIVLTIGLNDLRRRSDSELIRNYSDILGLLGEKQIYISSILPVDANVREDMDGYARRITDVNLSLQNLADSKANVTFVDNENYLDTDGDNHLDSDLHVGDGVHLNSEGNAKWARSLRLGIGG